MPTLEAWAWHPCHPPTNLPLSRRPQLDADSLESDNEGVERINFHLATIASESTMAPLSRRTFVTHSAHAALAGWVLGQGQVAHAAAADGKKTPPRSRKPLEVCLVSGSLEYHSDESLAALQTHLEKRFAVRCTRAFMKSEDNLPGLENLDTCDCMLLFTRRLKITGESLQRIKRYCQSGRAIVGLRTASHALQNWLELDREVLGGDYHTHYGNSEKPRIELVASAKSHPIVEGFEPFVSNGSLYKNPKIANDVTLLLTGTIPQHTEPVAWTRNHRGGRVCYTSLGHPDDFREASFLRLVVNAIFWTSDRKLPGQ